jgi:hypothetical protein
VGVRRMRFGKRKRNRVSMMFMCEESVEMENVF